jgi:DNA transformation protein
MSIDNLRNIGPKSAALLRAAGIDSFENLREIGAVAAYRRVKFADPRTVSLNMLWALQGALTDRDWREISASDRDRLRADAESDGQAP